MRRPVAVPIVLVAAALLGASMAQTIAEATQSVTPPATKAIRFGTLVDGTGAVLSNAIVVVEGDRIALERATFVGEETGGAVGGGAGVGAAYGELSPTLPASHLNVDIPAEAGYTFAHPSTRRRGTRPKHAVRQTFADLLKGRDTVLEFTRELIRRGGQF